MSETFEHRYVDVDGINTHYIEAGDANEETLILIHGGGSSSCAELNYGAAVGPLSRDLHVIALDMVGYGRTPCPSSEYYPATAQGDFVVRFLETLDLVAHVGGNSLGGWMANYVAHEAPDRVKSLLVINSRGATATPDDRYVVWDPNLRNYRPPRRPWTKAKSHSKGAPTRESVRRKMEKNFENKELVTDELIDLVLEMGNRNNETATARWQMCSSTEDDNRNNQMYRGKYMCEHAGSLETPVLMTWSRENPGSAPIDALSYFNSLRDGQMHIFSGARHHVMTELPEEWSAVVRDFVLAHG